MERDWRSFFGRARGGCECVSNGLRDTKCEIFDFCQSDVIGLILFMSSAARYHSSEGGHHAREAMVVGES